MSRHPRLDQEAHNAVRNYADRGLVFVVGRGPKGEIAWHGTGTLWRAASGSNVLLTARHIVEGHRSFTVGRSQTQIRLRDAVVIPHPTDDLALVELPRDASTMGAFDVEVLADVAVLNKGAGLVVTGFPQYLALVDKDDQGEITLFSAITYFGIAAGSDASAISIKWEESETSAEAAAAYERLGIKAGRQPMKKPAGISGGAVWLWNKVGEGQLWVPSRAVRFVGVPHEFTNRRQLAVPVWRWRPWLLEHLGVEVARR